MPDSQLNSLQVSLPGAGQNKTYTLTADTPIEFTFDLTEAVFTGNNGNLEIAVENGGTVILENYQALAKAEALPAFQTVDGEQVAGDIYLFAFENAEDTTEDIETAGDAAGGGSGAGEYSDNPGELFDGLDSLDGQGDAYAPHALLQIAGYLGNNPPVAVDDEGVAIEEGDHDLIPGKYINFVEYEFNPEETSEDMGSAGGSEADLYQAYLHENLTGWDEGDFIDPQFVTFLPLSGEEGGGILIYNPNPTQTPYIEEGNVLENDFDVDGDPLVVRTIDYMGENHEGVDELGESVTGDTVVMGKYGVLVLGADGEWTYTLNQEWADELNEGETFDEIFEYTISDGFATSNTATLTITVHGSNDMPTAVDDFNVEAVELGDSTGYNLEATATDLDSETGSATVHDIEGNNHDFTGSQFGEDGDGDGEGEGEGEGEGNYFVMVEGNVLAGDELGGAADTDPDSGPAPDVESLFVVGLYSHATQTVDYERPTEGNTGEPFDFTGMTDDQKYWDIAKLPDGAEYEVAGKFGVLTLQPDGGYEYVLYTPEDEGSYEALNALNYNTADADRQDVFTYGIMDDSGAFSNANLTFTVNGANDAPVAENNTASVNEFGAEDYFPGITQAQIAAVSTMTGNVITDDDATYGQDSDVDDADIFISDIYTKVESDGGMIRDTTNEFDVYNDEDTSVDAAQQVTIQGQYGTLTINANGSYSYVLDNDNPEVNALNEGDTLPETFYYTTRNSYEDGVESNEASLEITIEGSNDAPTLDLSANTVTFEGETAGYHNMLGVYTTDADGNPINPEIIIANGNAAGLDVGDVVATYADGQELHYFLVDVGYGSTPQGTPEFVWNETKGQWDVSFDGADPINVRFDDMALNQGDPEVTFKIEDLTTGRGLRLDDQFETDPGVGYDDDDYIDLQIEEHDNPGTGYSATYVENGDPISITGHVNIADPDSAMIQQATIAVNGPAGDTNGLNFNGLPAGWTIDDSDPTLLVLTGPNGETQSLADFEDALEAITFGNASEENPVEGDWTFGIKVQDEHGAWSEEATSTIEVEAVNDLPIAIHDGYHEINITPAVAYQEAEYRDAELNDFSDITGNSVSHDSITITGYGDHAQLVDTGNGLGIDSTRDVQKWHAPQHDDNGTWWNPFDDSFTPGYWETVTKTDNTSEIDRKGPNEWITIDVDGGADNVSFTLGGIDNYDMINVRVDYEGTGHFSFFHVRADWHDVNGDYTGTVGSWTNPFNGSTHQVDKISLAPTDKWSDFTVKAVTVPNAILDKPEILAQEEIIDITAAAAVVTGAVAGNVLANDFDPDNASINPANDDLDVLAVNGFDASNGTFNDDGELVVTGQYGVLEINLETGAYEYTPNSGIEHSGTDTFTYTVIDGNPVAGSQGDVAQSESTLEFSLNVDPVNVISDEAPVFLGTEGDDVIFATDLDTIDISQGGADTIVIDPEYMDAAGDNTININGFGSDDTLDLGNMIGRSVTITEGDNDELNLLFSDINTSDGDQSFTVTLNNVMTGADLVAPMTIDIDSQDLNQVIQDIINSGAVD